MDTSSLGVLILGNTFGYNSLVTVQPNGGLVNVNSSVLGSHNMFNGNSNPPSPCDRPPVIKKSSHNAIERRYRNSINDKILELKNLIAGEEAKVMIAAKLKRNFSFTIYLTDEQISHLEEGAGICSIPPTNESKTNQGEHGFKDGLPKANCQRIIDSLDVNLNTHYC